MGAGVWTFWPSEAHGTDATPAERQRRLLEEAQHHAEALDKLAGQMKNADLKGPMERSLQNLQGTLDALQAMNGGGRVSIPIQRAPVPFNPSTVEVKVGVTGPGGQPMAVGVEVPIETLDQAPPIHTRVIPEKELNDLLDALAQEGFADRRLSLLRSACSEALVTVDQAISIIDVFQFGTDKVEAGAFLYQRLSDPENFHRVYGALDFDTDKESLRRRTE